MNQQQEPNMSQYDAGLINRLKQEIMNDLKARQEWQDQYYDEMEETRRPGMGYGRRRFRPRPGYGRGLGRIYGWCPAPPASINRSAYESDYDWWLEREEYDYQRNKMLLRKELQNELRAMQQINQVRQTQDPQVRQLVYELLQETNQQGMAMPELMQSVGTQQNPGVGSSLLDRIIGPLGGVDRQSFLWGAGAALVGVALLPVMSKTLRPFARRAVEEVLEITERTQGMFEQVKEEFEDIVAEASFNKMKNSMSGPTDGEKGK